MTTATAPGKIILFGEHAVVYGEPAIAVPVREVSVEAEVDDLRGASPGTIFLEAPDIGLRGWLHEAPPDQPLARTLQLVLDEFDLHEFTPIRVHVHSTIPIAAGLGSGTAVTVAVIRAFAEHFRLPLPLQRQSELAYEIEVLHHGTPSGIDNTVVTFERPIYFVRGTPPEPFDIGSPFTIVIADTGKPSPTSQAVQKVRRAWEADRERYEALFEAIGQTAREARGVIERGQVRDLGPLMDHNQALLEALGVSCEEIQALIAAARSAKALGVKLSGAGLGGNVIALVRSESAKRVEDAMHGAGAVRTILTQVGR